MKTPKPLITRRLALSALVLALVGAMAFVALRAGPLAPTRVTLTPVREAVLHPALFGIGTVEARRSWTLGPTTAGRVLAVRVDVGDRIRAGQLLAEMEPVDLDQRLAALDAALARADSAQAAAQAQVGDAQARRELASANTRRNQGLAAQNFISAGALEARLQEQASAEAVLAAAQANLRASAQDLARQKAERAALARQRGQLRLFAPADAVVATRDAEPGSTLVAGQPLLRLIDPDSLWVRLRVDQGRSQGLAPGLPAQIVLRSRAQQSAAGRVARVELLADSVTEERIAQVAFDAPQALAGAAVGELAEVTLQLPPTPAAPVVPGAALQRWQGQTGVWRLQDGKSTFTPVQAGARAPDGSTQVLQGLRVGDEVVVYSHKALAPGARVKVVDALVGADKAGGGAP